MALEVLDFVGALEIAGIHHADLHKHKIAKDSREHAQHREEGVQPQAVEAVDQHDCRLGLGVQCGRRRVVARLADGGLLVHVNNCGQLVKVSEILRRLVVMAFDQHRERHHQARHHQRDPAALEELHHTQSD